METRAIVRFWQSIAGANAAALKRIYLEATGASPNEFDTPAELADRIIKELREARGNEGGSDEKKTD